MNRSFFGRIVLWSVLLGLAGLQPLSFAQEIRTMDYVALKDGKVVVFQKGEPKVLDHDLTLTPELTVLTNGNLHITGTKDVPLPPGRKLTLDGFWLGEDGMLASFGPHYIVKDRVLYFVREGQYQPVDQEVIFANGLHLRPDGTVLTPDQRVIRLQDGQGLTAAGTNLAALDHIMMINSKLVLQKDGSLISLPAGVMGMSDGTKVTPEGEVTPPGGAPFLLKNGQRVTVPGPIMPSVN
jgi:hypothetical protein